jgi:hypothetical protein
MIDGRSLQEAKVRFDYALSRRLNLVWKVRASWTRRRSRDTLVHSENVFFNVLLFTSATACSMLVWIGLGIVVLSCLRPASLISVLP